MEIHENTTDENRRRTLTDDPQYFGAYLNLARLNIFSINNYLAKEFKKRELREDGQIKNCFIAQKGLSDISYNWLYERLIRFMPVIKQFDAERLPEDEKKNTSAEGKDLEGMSDMLKSVWEDIQEFRNDYTHYYSTEKGDQRKLTVSDATAAFLKLSFERAIQYTKKRFENVLDSADFELVASKQMIADGNTITTEGFVFLIAMFLDRENAFQFIGKVKGLKGTQFKPFIATREVLMTYCVKLPHDKLLSDNPGQALLLDMINDLTRCPKVLYNVLSEEGKKEFRPLLTDQKIEKVLANSISDEERENILDSIDYEQYIENLTVRVRHSNRFPYFAMRFIEEKNLWPEIYFQIDLGKYQLAEYSKKVLGENIPRTIIENAKAFGRLNSFNDEDSVQKQIDLNGLTPGFEQFAPHYNTDINKIGLSFAPAMPAMPAVIPLQNKPDNKVQVNLEQPQPDAFLSLHELSKIILLEYLQPGASRKLIHQFCSLASKKLFSYSFIEEVKGKLPNQWSEFQKQCDTKKSRAYSGRASFYPHDRKDELNRILAPYGLNDKQIPEKIINYWLNINDVNDTKTVSERIKRMNRDGRKRLKQLTKHYDDPEIKIPKIGEMATFIARDIVDMIVSGDKKKKITSVYYDKMQECLALYANADKKQQFIALVRELNMNAPGGHPFLKKLNLEQINSTSEFYKLYLKEKVDKQIPDGYTKAGKQKHKNGSWMSSTFETIEWNEKVKKNITVIKIPDNRENIPYTIRQWEEKEQYDLKAWLKNINEGRNENDRKRPVDLPTNLFDGKLCELLKSKLTETGVPIPVNAKYNELLKMWWTMRDDSIQPFYGGERCYEIKGEKIRFISGSASRFSDYYHYPLSLAFERLSAERRSAMQKDRRLQPLTMAEVEKVFKRTLHGTEQEIRVTAEDDRMLLLMAEKLSPGDEQLKLATIDKELTKLRHITHIFSYNLNYDTQGNKAGEAQSLKANLTVTATMQLKNINDLHRFAYDRRLPELVAYIPDATIDVEALRYELADYNRARQEVFDAVFRLEKAIIEKDAESIRNLFTDMEGNYKTGNIQHRPYLQWLTNKGKITEEERWCLNMVRKSFSHNQFPHREVAVKWNLNIEPKGIASQLAAVFKRKTEAIVDSF
ncbi:type VI-B CRISPR-associated RNA-guided ribonuclease Cas13b [Microbacter margulisiae]|uniref:Uncharacterized protein n=1 Tax=Microbacter margulisiae TaxID=1350067 RepID=A0A7W5H2D6_9PORP|nr:type VI-B CRISPR-associated RNA-guided ribonuclease Cas13b [Microbacter margulisiae]MBB3187519.1 hypothetical protein [Microbacter margulisiae]